MLARRVLLPAMLAVLLLLVSCTDSKDVFVRRTGAEGATGPTAYALPQGGTFDSPVSVTLSADEPATIYYTLDGSDPLASQTEYTAYC